MFGILFALISTMTWSYSTILYKRISCKVSLINIVIINSLIGFLLMFLLSVIFRKNLMVEHTALYKMAISGIIGIAVADTLFYKSLKFLSAVALQIVFLVIPLFYGFLGYVYLNETPSLYNILGFFIIIIGIILNTCHADKNKLNIKLKFHGLILAILSFICMSYSMVITKPLFSDWSVMVVTAYRSFFGGLALLIISILTNRFKSITINETETAKLKQVISVAFLYNIGGTLCSMLAVKYCHLFTVSSIMVLEPIFTLLFLICFYKHKPLPKEILNIFLIVFGIILMTIF